MSKLCLISLSSNPVHCSYADSILYYNDSPAEALNKAKLAITERKWSLDETYLCLIPKGSSLKCTVDRSKLKADLYQIPVVYKKYTNYRYCLFRSSLEVEYDSLLQQWNVKAGNKDYTAITQAKLENLSLIVDCSDLSGRLGQFRLCSLTDEHHLQYAFELYLSKQYQQALAALAGIPKGDNELYWCSLYLGAKCSSKLDSKEAVSQLLEAYSTRPERVESLYSLAKYYRKKSQNELAYLYAASVINLKQPNDTWLLQPDVYSYLVGKELAIIGSKTKLYQQQSALICDSLLLSVGLPSETKEDLLWASSGYFSRLPFDWMLPMDQKGNCASFCKQDKCYLVLVCNGSSLKLVKYDSFMKKVLSEKAVKCDLVGICDLSLFLVGSRIWFSCRCNETWKLARISKMTESDLSLDKIVDVSGPSCMPYLDGSEWNLVTNWSPSRQSSLDSSIVFEKTLDVDLSLIEYATAPISYENGYLTIVRSGNGHRFLMLDKSYLPIKISLGFYFEQMNAEVCAGISYDHGGKQITLMVSSEEKVKVYGLSEEKVKMMLRAL